MYFLFLVLKNGVPNCFVLFSEYYPEPMNTFKILGPFIANEDRKTLLFRLKEGYYNDVLIGHQRLEEYNYLFKLKSDIFPVTQIRF